MLNQKHDTEKTDWQTAFDSIPHCVYIRMHRTVKMQRREAERIHSSPDVHQMAAQDHASSVTDASADTKRKKLVQVTVH